MQVAWLLQGAFVHPQFRRAVLPGTEVWGLAFGIMCIGTEFILGFLSGNVHGYLRPMSWLRVIGKVMPGPPPQQVA